MYAMKADLHQESLPLICERGDENSMASKPPARRGAAVGCSMFDTNSKVRTDHEGNRRPETKCSHRYHI